MESPVVPPSGTIRRSVSYGNSRRKSSSSQQISVGVGGARCLDRADSDTDAACRPDGRASAEFGIDDEPPPKLMCTAQPSMVMHSGPFVVTVVGTRTTGSMLFKQLPDELYQCLLSSICEPVVLSPVLARCDRRALFIIAIRTRVAGHRAMEKDPLSSLFSAVPVADIVQCVAQGVVILPTDHCRLMARTIVVQAHYE